jgi:predicted  nucleic acid-binding Zn-ribbon protein
MSVLKGYECTKCGYEFQAFVEEPCPHCGAKAQRVLGPFNIGAGALETKGKAVRDAHQRDVNLDYDRGAYKRLVDSGVQPGSINGAYDMERRATSPVEFERNAIAPNENVRKRLEEGQAASRDLGLIP